MGKISKTISLSVLYILIMTFCSGCHFGKYEKSDAVEQRIIFPQYSVVYNDESQSTIVSAIFSVNNPAGKSLCLNDKSSIACNGESLRGKYDNDLDQYAYNRQFDGQWIENWAFEYINNDEQKFENAISVGKLDLGIETLNISKSAGITYLHFKGSQMTEEETIELMIGDDAISLMASGNQIIFSGELFDDVAVGVYDGVFVRSHITSDIKAMDRGGSISAQYKTKKIKISITA